MLTDQRIEELAREATLEIDAGGILDLTRSSVRKAIRTAIRETQEACAKVCDRVTAENMELGADCGAIEAIECADAIRKAGSIVGQPELGPDRRITG